MSETVVKIENLVKNYAELRALDHLNLEIKEGEVFGLIGHNGAGKTTLLRMISTILKILFRLYWTLTNRCLYWKN